MLREEQVDIRRQRGKSEQFRIGKADARTRLFGSYHVSNPKTAGDYIVNLRGFDVGDNTCSCPDFKANTLGTCKHIEAVLAEVGPKTPERLKRRKAAVTRPEVHLHYGEQVCLHLLLPPRCSDPLRVIAHEYFDKHGHWSADHRYQEFVAAAAQVPEAITFDTEALEFIDHAIDADDLRQRGDELNAALERGETPALLENLLTVPLYAYQMHGVVFAASGGRTILGDDMGLGKTLQALGAAELLARLRGINRVLVVAPASVKYQWETEITKFTQRSVQVIDGDRPIRLEQYRDDVFFRLVNYEQVTRDLAEINATKPDLVILDEAQRIKNWESKTSRAVKKLQSRYALVLTGTPLENKLEELYSIVEFVDNRRLGPAFQFLHDHRVLDGKGNLTGYRNLESIRTKLAPIFLRRTRAEVATQLPERIDSTIFVELTAEQQALYEEQRAALGRLIARPVLSDLDRKRILACLTTMRMICNSLELVDATKTDAPKLEEFAALISELVAEGADHKAVVFSQWEGMLHLAAKLLDQKKIGYAMLFGRLPAADRKDPIARFNDDPKCRVFLSTDAGGSGLNLQVADTVIHLEVPWNPAVLNQRIARVHRLGQSRPVRNIRLLTRDSIEDRVLQVLEQKQALFDGLFADDSDDVSFAGPGQAKFFDAVRAALDVTTPAVVAATSARDKLALAGVSMLEAIAELLAGRDIDPELAARCQAALQKLTQALPAAPPCEP